MTEKQVQRQIQTETYRQRETNIDTERQTETDRDRQTDRGLQTDRQRIRMFTEFQSIGSSSLIFLLRYRLA